MGAIERNGYRFEPEYSVIGQNGAIMFITMGSFGGSKVFISGKYPELNQIEQLVDEYCEEKGI